MAFKVELNSDKCIGCVTCTRCDNFKMGLDGRAHHST
jgi:ferredoxin